MRFCMMLFVVDGEGRWRRGIDLLHDGHRADLVQNIPRQHTDNLRYPFGEIFVDGYFVGYPFCL